MTTPEASRTKIRAKDVFESYFLKHHQEDLTEILQDKEDVERHYPVFVNFLTLFEEHTEVAESLLTSPAKLLPVLDQALISASTKLMNDLKDDLKDGLKCDLKNDLTLKTTLHARITGLPSCPELYRDSVPRTSDVGRLLCVVGTVVRISASKMLEYKKEFMCTKCKHVFTVEADHDQYYQLNKPSRCPNPVQCHSSFFSIMTPASRPVHTKDYQEIKLQEQIQKLKMTSIPGSIWVTLEDDLVNSCRPGDDVVVCGIVRQRWRPLVREGRPNIDLVLKANNVMVDSKESSSSSIITEEVREEIAEFWRQHKHNPLAGRNIILASICPEVYGLYVVKLALAVVLAGGVQRTTTTNTRIRGDAHLLLVGDPGTAKSQLLKSASSLVPRSVMTTGMGTTSTGLTVTAVREDGEWTLEAGALVIADGGVCCIDEFNTMREADRASIHEAMEQQTISVAKAGVVCKLDSRCNVLAAMNPKVDGSLEDTLDFINLASPLLSRFDLVFMLLDVSNPNWDRLVSNYIISGHDPGETEGTGGEEGWDQERIRVYLCLIRSLQPKMTTQANEVLSRYYLMQRQCDQLSKSRVTIRLLESLVRLSQGHARLLMREEVGVQDAVVAISLLEASLGGCTLLMNNNALCTTFPCDVLLEYRTQVQVILQKLSLPDILRQEITRVDQEQQQNNNNNKKNKKKTEPIITSTQKNLPFTSLFQSRKEFRCSVNDDSFGLDIEELNETSDRRKRPRVGPQQTLNKWVESESSFGPQIGGNSPDDLELITPKKKRSRKEVERGSSQTRVKNIKLKKIRNKIPKDVTKTPSPPSPPFISDVDRARDDLLVDLDLDDFAKVTWTPSTANIKKNFTSTIAKLADKKTGKEKNKFSETLVNNDSDSLGKQIRDEILGQSLNIHNETLIKKSDSIESQQKRINSTTKGEESMEFINPTKSLLITDQKEKLNTTITSSRKSSIAKLKRFSFSPLEENEEGSLRESEKNNDIRQNCRENTQNMTNFRQESLSENDRLSLTYMKMIETNENVLKITNNITKKMIDFENEKITSSLMKEREIEPSPSNSRNKERMKEKTHSLLHLKIRENIKTDQQMREKEESKTEKKLNKMERKINNNNNTKTSSSSPTSTSTSTSTKPKVPKAKRFSFALNEEDDGEMKEKELNYISRVNPPSIKQTTDAPSLSPTTPPTTQKRCIFYPSPLARRPINLSLPSANNGLNKYKALESDEFDEFDFEL